MQGKVAVVTGGSTGIGRAIAARFVAEGARVVITGRRKPELDAAVEAIGRGVRGVHADSSDLGDLDALYRSVQEEEGRIDVLVANAGGGVANVLGSITEEEFDSTFGTNVKGVLFTVQKALPLLADGASVILTGSTTSIKAEAGISVYAASKAAVRNLARGWVLDLKGRDVRVNVLSPGPTDTPGMRGLAEPGQEQALVDAFAARVPLGRVADPAEIAGAAVFLASNDSGFVNGVELFVDGGFAQV
ncbi:SDR family oxidoreductase [Lentzea tibetensis]|uniref:SDR family oxidoreductase n=1 Tax=Lentzea tibetensis TaxID=2591470 RepID=A0A563ELN4_9PSEU|nr:SDR family oxidoreductase [Lentzea tibetensis]TWP48009.1 SDR family oxidoreductase [Lentzea tibetensis]